jgi:membrane protease subunit HflC
MTRNIKILIGSIIGVVFILFNSIFIVQQYQQVLLLQFGELIKVVKTPGLHFKIPFIQTPSYFDNRILNVSAEEKELIAKDQKRVIISAYAKYKIVDPLKFFQTVKNISSLQSRLSNLLDTSLRQVIGDEPLSSLLTQERSKMMQRIQHISNLQSKKFGVDVIDVRILRADLPNENSSAIYKRMQSGREKEAKEIRAQGAEEAEIIIAKSDKERIILLAEATKKAQNLRGQGDAEATKIYAKAYSKDPEFYNFYRSLESYKKTFDSKNTEMYLSTHDKYLQFFNQNLN